MSHVFAIMNVAMVPPTYFNEKDVLVLDINEAKRYDTLQKGRDAKCHLHEKLSIWGDQQKDYVVVPVPEEPQVAPQKHLPIPDFYEVPRFITAEHIYSLLVNNDFDLCFSACDAITMSGQMMSRAVAHPITGQVVGREFSFSFPGAIKGEDQRELQLMADGAWSACIVQNRGHGVTAWSIVTLKTACK